MTDTTLSTADRHYDWLPAGVFRLDGKKIHALSSVVHCREVHCLRMLFCLSLLNSIKKREEQVVLRVLL